MSQPQRASEVVAGEVISEGGPVADESTTDVNANATLTASATTTPTTTPPPATNTTPEIIPDRVFVGNLPYEVTEEEVRQLTPELHIVSIEIPKKPFFNKQTNQSVLQSKGYGFITYDSAEAAKQAIASIEGKQIQQRDIYAKAAIPQKKRYYTPQPYQSYQNYAYQPTAPPANIFYPYYPGSPPPSPFFYRSAFYRPAQEPLPTEAAVPGNGTSAGSGNDLSSNGIAVASVPAAPSPIPLAMPRDFHTYRPRQRTREEKQRKLERGIPSKTTIFVGNLERTVTVTDLKLLFQGLQPEWVRVPRKTLPKFVYQKLKAAGVPIQNKGIAFVRFATQEQQGRAIAEFNGQEYRGKQLNVMVAIDSVED